MINFFVEYPLPYFGSIDMANLQGGYRTKIDFGNCKVSLDINFDSKQIDVTEAERIKNFLLRLEEFDQGNRGRIQKDFIEKEGETHGYLMFYTEELGEEELLGISMENPVTRYW